MTLEHTDSQHSILSPSSANRWVRCPGSISLCATLKSVGTEQDSSEAEEGTAAHEFAAHSLSSGSLLPVGSVAANGYVLTAEMLESVSLYFHYCKPHLDSKVCRIEEPIRCDSIHPKCWGTPDIWWYDEPSHTLEVPDFKHGRMSVEVVENYQCIIYCRAAIDELERLGVNVAGLKIRATIVQPRGFHHLGPIRTWNTTPEELSPYIDEIACGAHEAMSQWPRCRPGPQCRKCPGRLSCNANAKATAAICDLAESATPVDLTPEQLGVEWVFLKRAVAMLTSRFDMVDEAVKYHASRGQSIPAIRAAPGRGRQEWEKTPTEIAAIGDLYGVDLRKPLQVITPKQAIAAGIDKRIVNSPLFTDTRKTGIKITEASSTDAALIFGNAGQGAFTHE